WTSRVPGARGAAACSSSVAGRSVTSARSSRSRRPCAKRRRTPRSSSSVVVAGSRLTPCAPRAFPSMPPRCRLCATPTRACRSRTTIAGNPIRRSLLRWTRESGRRELGLPADATVVFVTGGSQGSAAINHAVSGALPRLLRRATVIHHTGDAHLAPIAAKRETLPGDLRDRYHVYGFLREEMGAALASADLVVGRASSS